MSSGEALAYGAEPFWGYDGSLYMVYGAREPGNIRVVQLNASSGRLPHVALPGHRPGDTDLSNDHVYHHVASGPSFELGQDTLASPYDAAAYIDGKVKPHNENRSFVQNAFVLPSNATGSAQYFLFVDWYLAHGDGSVHNSTTRVHVGRSADPTGPFYDRDGFDMKERRPVILGGDRTIAVVSASWGANCDGGVGYDILAAAKKNCDGRARCDWALTYMELDQIDPEAYRDFDDFNQQTTWHDQYSDTPENYAEEPGCLRAVNISYRCTDDSDTDEHLLYEHETRSALEHVHVPAEAANGSIAVMECATPSAIMLPGGSLFADSTALGGSLHFTGPSHSGVFTYDKDGENRTLRKARLEELLAKHNVSGGRGPDRLDEEQVVRYTRKVAELAYELARLERRYVFTFQYTTPRSATPEIGARRLFFEADGWPTLDQDVSQEWRSCSERGDLPFPLKDLAGIPQPPSYTSSSSTLTHCSYHSQRAGHCIGNSLRASHPLLGTVLPEEPAMMGSIDEEGTAAWWRERRDKCDPRVETVLGEKLECTRDRGERLRVCKPRMCDLPGQKCKKLPQRGVAYWDSADLFDGGMPVYLTSSGYQYTTAPISATCEATPHISEIEPSIGIADGGTAVTVRGTGFGEPMRCRFGHLETLAYNVTAHSAICPSPALSGVLDLNFTRFTLEAQMRVPVPLEVSMMSRAVLARTPLKQRIRDARGDNFTRSLVMFQYYNESRIFVSFVRPQGGPTAGGSHIDVRGFGFLPSSVPQKSMHSRNVKCRFGGSVLVPATYHSPWRMSCVTPPSALNTNVLVDVTFDDQEYINSNATFDYFTMQNISADNPLPSASVLIDKLQPHGGPASGGTLLTILGTGFSRRDAPQTEDGPLDTELYESDEPRHDLQRSFMSRDGTFCLFEGIVVEVPGAVEPLLPPLLRETVPATVVSDSEIVCYAPPKTAAELSEMDCHVMNGECRTSRLEEASNVVQMVNVSITINGNPKDRTNSDHAFAYYRDDDEVKPRLRFASPRGGPTAGGTVVEIASHRIRDLSGPYATPMCQFGDPDHIVSANVSDPGDGMGEIIRCVSPPLLGYEETLDVRLTIAPNGVDFIRGRALRFTYYPLHRVNVERLHPQGGPQHGGVVVRLSGTHLANRGGVLCRFGTEIVPARPTGEVSGWDALLCESPPLTLPSDQSYLTVGVQVTVNNDTLAFGPTQASYTYFDTEVAAEIGSIYPSSGPARGGTEVKVRATLHEGNTRRFGDFGGLFCQFGTAPPVPAILDAGPATPAQIIDTAYATPRFDVAGEATPHRGRFDVEVGQWYLHSTTGPCVINGDCFCSSNYPGGACAPSTYEATYRTAGEDVQRNAQPVPEHHRTFGRPETCSITFSKPARLNVHVFSVAPGSADHYPGRFYHTVAAPREVDLMTVDTTVVDVHGRYRRVYAGNAGPDGELVTALSWSSDGSTISDGFKICAARKWSQTALNTTRYVADQPLGRLRDTHEDTHEFWCEAPSAASACNGTFDANGLCSVPVRITVNNETWGAPVNGGFVFYQS